MNSVEDGVVTKGVVTKGVVTKGVFGRCRLVNLPIQHWHRDASCLHAVGTDGKPPSRFCVLLTKCQNPL
ncbi:MAG TPA: hypothetical protein EYG03_10935 [Planctomycetes bacterium]|nr:hypothetical protein [Planctomycetota bacterium]